MYDGPGASPASLQIPSVVSTISSENCRVLLEMIPQVLSKLILSSILSLTVGESNKAGKLLKIFSIVKFPNSGCSTTVGGYGVCYTATECSSLGQSTHILTRKHQSLFAVTAVSKSRLVWINILCALCY